MGPGMQQAYDPYQQPQQASPMAPGPRPGEVVHIWQLAALAMPMRTSCSFFQWS